ncbi:MAG: hypothetical protein M0Z55_02670 [Peptococcaceae bacterium]|nr:hypothetical protein [Peptococcaceae bacterium]
MLGLIALLAIAGIILLAVEIFVIPGFGVSGILGIIALTAAIIIAAKSVVEALLYGGIVLILIGLAVYYALRTNKLQKRLFLKTRQANSDGYVAPRVNDIDLPGRCGRALTPLRPAGTAEFDGERLDVVTEGGFIAKGAIVKVLRVEGARIIVREPEPGEKAE